MDEITPDLVAAVASKIYNQAPLAMDNPRRPVQPGPVAGVTAPAIQGQIPTSSEFPNAASCRPTIDSNQHPLASSLLGMLPVAKPTLPSHPPGYPPTVATPVAATGLHSLPDGTGVPEAAVDSGLQQFVQRVRSGHQQPPIRFIDLGKSPQRDFGHESAFVNLARSPAQTRPFDVHAIRRDFPILHQSVNGQPLVWFDNAATTQKPLAVIDALSHYYAHNNSNIHRAAHTLAARSTEAFEEARRTVQSFIGASSTKEIVWVRGTTEGINLVAQTFGRKFLQAQDEILLSTLEHHANIVPWQLIARETGARLRVIPVNDAGEIMLGEYEALLGPRTKLVALTQASNSLGTILPVAEMTRLAHRYGARVLVDGAQSIAHFPVDVRQIGCDFFVFSGHKVFAPMGVGVVYIREELLDYLPPWQGGGNMIRNVTFDETTYAEPPARFEAGTPTVADAIGLGVALKYVTQLGMENVARHEQALLEYGTARLSKIPGLTIFGQARDKVSVISFTLKNHATEAVGKALDQQGIAVRAGHHCAQPSLRRFGLEATVRPSFSIYNTVDEIDRLVEAIKRIQSGVTLPV